MRTNTINNLFMMVEGKKHKGQQKSEGLEESIFSALVNQLTAGDKQSISTGSLLTSLEKSVLEDLEQNSITAEQDDIDILGGKIQVLKDLYGSHQSFAGTEEYIGKAELNLTVNTFRNALQGDLSCGEQSKASTGKIVPSYIPNKESSGQLENEVSISNNLNSLHPTSTKPETVLYARKVELNSTIDIPGKALQGYSESYEQDEYQRSDELQLFHNAIDDVPLSNLDKGQLEKEAIPNNMVRPSKNLDKLPQIPVMPEIFSDREINNLVVNPGLHKEKNVIYNFVGGFGSSYENNMPQEADLKSIDLNLNSVPNQELDRPLELKGSKEFVKVKEVSHNAELTSFKEVNKDEKCSEVNNQLTKIVATVEKDNSSENPSQIMFIGSKVLEEQPQQVVKNSTNPNTNILQNKINDQIIKKFTLMQKNGLSQVNVDLKPEFLGQVSISLTFERGKVIAKIEVAKEEVKKLLEGQVSQLKTALNELNIKVEDFKIEQSEKETPRNNHKEGYPGDDKNNRGNQHFEGRRNYKSSNVNSFESEERELPLASTLRFANNEVNYMV